MSDEAALLRAIVESPDDLTLRLIYADWCEENGRAARASLIRGQCFLDPLLEFRPTDDYGGMADPRFLPPHFINQDLRESVLEAFRPIARESGLGWDDDGITTPYSNWYGVRRGFVESLNLQGLSQLMDFLPHAAHILARTPLLSLRVYRNWGVLAPESGHLPAELVRQLLAVDGIVRLEELHVAAYNVGEAAARVLVNHGGKLRLRSLALSERSLGRRTRDELRERFGDALNLSPSMSGDDIPF